MTTYSKRGKYLFLGLFRGVVTGAAIGLLLLVSSFVMSAPKLLLKSDQSWDGGSFSYPQGDAEITSVKLKLPAGKKAPFHCHPVPTMGYISKGKVQLETQAGQVKEYKEGDSVIEVMKTVHRGVSLKRSSEIIVFYAGALGIPTTVFPDDKDNFKKYCQ